MPDLDWQQIRDMGLWPPRLQILETMLTDPPEGDPGWSSKTLTDTLGDVTLGAIAHHVRALARAGVIREVGTRPRRGAIQKFYVLSDTVVAKEAP